MKRRDFLKLSSAATLAYSMNGLPIHALGNGTLAKTRATNGKILVLIRMNGGNDGLNTLIPIDKYSELSAARSNVLIPQSKVLSLSGTSVTGLHPSMTGMRDLYNSGKMNIIQGISYPDPNYSHFRSTDIMFSASDSNTYIETGWIGRFLDNRFPGAPQAYPDPNFLDPLSIEIGTTVSSVLNGANGLNGLAVSDVNYFYNIVNGTVDPAPATPAGNELTYIRFISQQTQAYTQVIENAANAGTNMVTYPNSRLGNQLQAVAKLISGGLKTPIYLVNIGGFDTHDNQVDAADHTLGEHAQRLQRLSEAISAFQQDLKLQNLENKVTGCTFTEFGRRVKSNASDGTDHGAAGPMFVFGSEVNPTIIGSNPVLPASATVHDNVPMQYDFRQVYATILQDWFKLPTADVTSILNGQSFQTLPIFKATTGTTTLESRSTKMNLHQNFPNPFRSHTTIRFSTEGGMAQIVLYDEMGRMLRVLYENDVPAGTYDIGVDRNALPAGIYYYQLQVGSSSKLTQKMVIVD